MRMKLFKTIIFLILFWVGLPGTGLLVNYAVSQPVVANAIKGKPFNNITLEVSLKPFKKNEKAYIEAVAREMFTQWSSLLRHADTVSIMLWTSDGSEILDYTGKLNQPLEWAKYIGNPNTKNEVGSGPKSLSLHERAYLYTENPPNFTYKDLKYIVEVLKKTGHQLTGKIIRVGATFDPGPEFAKSDFKYKKHPEISSGSAMGQKSFVVSYATLNEDKNAYAGFPKGIPANTPFGVFFGRQSQHFLKDLGFDYLWLSNGFGFGMEPWSSAGVIFTGKKFETGKLAETRDLIVKFWTLFRKECPNFRIETRGTNLATGIDLAKDGVDLKSVYKGGFNILPPPNSPWAALNGDFGLELTGYMSRIAELPDNRYLFRYYTHDPWWLNSPWLDRYGREPHDIYLPMSVSRIDEQGKLALPTHLNFLTIDNSLGEMPAQVPDEVTPHILNARYNSPTAPGPLVWVYPFNEYHEWAVKQTQRIPEIYFGDWFIRQAINNGLPLNTVISSSNFAPALAANPNLFNQSILVSIIPDANSTYEKTLTDFIQNGGKVILYGPADYTSAAFKKLLNLKQSTAIEGEFIISKGYNIDSIRSEVPQTIRHEALFSGSGISTQVENQTDEATKVLVTVSQNTVKRDVAWVRAAKDWKGGKVVYLRGTNSSHYDGGQLLTPDDPQKYFCGPVYMRYLLKEFGLEYGIDKYSVDIQNPVLSISRSNNAFFFSGYVPNTTVKHKFRLPQGIPVFNGCDADVVKGQGLYSFPLSWNKECRFFVEQEGGVVSCREMISGELGITRRLQLTGLKNAVVRIYPEDHISDEQLNVYLNAAYPWKKGKIPFTKGEPAFGKSYKVENVSGSLVVSW